MFFGYLYSIIINKFDITVIASLLVQFNESSFKQLKIVTVNRNPKPSYSGYILPT